MLKILQILKLKVKEFLAKQKNYHLQDKNYLFSDIYCYSSCSSPPGSVLPRRNFDGGTPTLSRKTRRKGYGTKKGCSKEQPVFRIKSNWGESNAFASAHPTYTS